MAKIQMKTTLNKALFNFQPPRMSPSADSNHSEAKKMKKEDSDGEHGSDADLVVDDDTDSVAKNNGGNVVNNNGNRSPRENGNDSKKGDPLSPSSARSTPASSSSKKEEKTSTSPGAGKILPPTSKPSLGAALAGINHVILNMCLLEMSYEITKNLGRNHQEKFMIAGYPFGPDGLPPPGVFNGFRPPLPTSAAAAAAAAAALDPSRPPLPPGLIGGKP